MMLWLEGDPFWIPTPKNTHTRDIWYTQLAPIFASGADRLVVTVGKRYDARKTDMMGKRWNYIEFSKALDAEVIVDGVDACATCFATLMLSKTPSGRL